MATRPDPRFHLHNAPARPQTHVPGQGQQAKEIVPTIAQGGDLLEQIVHPDFIPRENLKRIQPAQEWFQATVTPRSPIQFEILSFRVPSGQQLWLSDYEFRVFRQSGLDPNDVVPAEEGRFSNVMGFDITLNSRRLSQLQYQLEASPAPVLPSSYQPKIGEIASNDQFVQARFRSFASSTGAALSILPVWSKVQGPRGMPFTFICSENSTVSLVCVIFRPIPAPIAFVEGRFAGHQVSSNVAISLIDRMRPR